MHGYVKNSRYLLWFWVCYWSVCVEANNQFVLIKQASLVQTADSIQLQAQIDFTLADTVREALHSGIPLYWDVSVELGRPQWLGLLNSSFVTKLRRYGLGYYTLLNRYGVERVGSHGMVKYFVSLEDALASMRLFVVEFDNAVLNLTMQDCILVELKVIFDFEALPAPLRPIAYFDADWALSADERRWCD